MRDPVGCWLGFNGCIWAGVEWGGDGGVDTEEAVPPTDDNVSCGSHCGGGIARIQVKVGAFSRYEFE